jgi:hypothetical protein
MFSGMIISAMTENTKIWFIIFWVLMMICVIAQAITENKQKECLEILEKKIKELVGDNNET